MALIRTQGSSGGGGVTLNPTVAHHNAKTSYDSATIDTTKKYLSVACLLIDDSSTRMGVQYIDNGVGTSIQTASYCNLTVSGNTAVCGVGAASYAEWTLIQLD